MYSTIEQIIFSSMPYCSKMFLNTGNMCCCARHSSRDGCSHFVCEVDHHDETWEQGRTTITDRNSHVNEPRM